MAERPGGAIAKRPLQFFYVVDTSGSMSGKKIESLNLAIRESIKPMQDVANENPNADILVRVIEFSDGAHWHLADPTNVHDFQWKELDADGVTDMGKALSLLAEAMKNENMPPRGLPPVIVLISDGMPTDDFNAGLNALLGEPWGKRAVRIGIAIGDDADLETLDRFIANPDIKPLRANTISDLTKYIKWASTVPLKAASSPRAGNDPNSNTPIPTAPPATSNVGAGDIF